MLAEGMGMVVRFFDHIPKLALGNAAAVDSLDELLAVSDVLTLHVPLTNETANMVSALCLPHTSEPTFPPISLFPLHRVDAPSLVPSPPPSLPPPTHLHTPGRAQIGKAELAKMKKGSYLINAARGQVLDQQALADAITAKHIAGAAVDVYSDEPASNADELKSPLRGLSNVILTPHIGGSTEEVRTPSPPARDCLLSLVSFDLCPLPSYQISLRIPPPFVGARRDRQGGCQQDHQLHQYRRHPGRRQRPRDVLAPAQGYARARRRPGYTRLLLLRAGSHRRLALPTAPCPPCALPRPLILSLHPRPRPPPPASLRAGTHRIMNFHKNIPGVLRDINQQLSAYNVRYARTPPVPRGWSPAVSPRRLFLRLTSSPKLFPLHFYLFFPHPSPSPFPPCPFPPTFPIHSGQMLMTLGAVGYLIVDVDQDVGENVKLGISALPASIKTRIAYS